MMRLKYGFATSVAMLAIACALTATYAQPAVAQTAKKLKCTGCVKSKQLKDGAITGTDIRNNTIGGAKIQSNAVTTNKIQSNAVTTNKIQNNAVTSNKIADGDVGTADLAANAVTSGKIADGAVAFDKLSPSVQAQLNAAGNGDITGVTAGSGLNGGGDTGDVTLNLDDNIVLGTAGDDGDLSVEDTTGTATVILDGDTGTVTNSLTGDGVVKAWARINADGTVASCYRCNSDPLETRILATGLYEVDFTPLSTDIRDRPRSVTADGEIAGVFGRASISDRIARPGPPAEPLDASSVFVVTRNLDSSAAVDRPFTIVIY